MTRRGNKPPIEERPENILYIKYNVVSSKSANKVVKVAFVKQSVRLGPRKHSTPEASIVFTV